MQNFSFKQKRIVLTGATGFVGSHFAKCVTGMSANLVLVDKNLKLLEKLANDLENNNEQRPEIYAVDLSVPKYRDLFISNFRKKHDSIDILINNAAQTGASLHAQTPDSSKADETKFFTQVLEVNLISSYELSVGLSPLMEGREDPNILNISSIYSSLGPDPALYSGTSLINPASYGVSKAGLEQLTRWLASTLGPTIRVNSISPGGILRGQEKDFIQKYENKTLLRRMATEQEIVEPMVFMISKMAKYITGETLVVDGGFSKI